jgi:hypothetical protein
MKGELLEMVEHEVLGWPGVSKERGGGGRGRGGFWVPPATIYSFGRRQIGHIHDDGHADFRFPREVRDHLIQSGQAISHPAFPNSRTMASYWIRSAEDVPGALELFRMNYERVAARDERKGTTM